MATGAISLTNLYPPLKKICNFATMNSIDTSYTVQTSQHRSALMGISILSIMMCHQYFTSTFPFNFFHIFGYWGVDIFLFLSGMGLVNSLNKNTISTYYKHRIVRLAPSCILCGSIKFIIFTALGSTLVALKECLHLGVWSVMSLDLWFIHSIIILYIISPVLYKPLSKLSYFSLIVILSIFLINELTLRPEVGYNWMTPIGVTAWTIERLPVFSVGMMMSIGFGTIYHKIPQSLVFLLLAIGLKILNKTYCPLYGIETCQKLCLILGMPALIHLCIIMLKNVPKTLYRALDFLGNHSLELYLVHEFIFFSIKISYQSVNPYCLLSFSFILSFLAASICKLITNKTCHLLRITPASSKSENNINRHSC
jgi:peptidoglycan/LPS O-acetylase OafA/YrhL